MKYLKEIGGKLIEPPKNYRKNNGSIIINYNLNEEKLIEDGYRQYTDEEIEEFYKNNSQNNDQSEEQENPQNILEMAFSKLKVKEKLVEMGLWESLKASLTDSEYEDLLLAKDLAFDNPTFVKFYNQLKNQIQNIDEILKQCI